MIPITVPYRVNRRFIVYIRIFLSCRPFKRLSSRPCPAKAYILPVIGISVLLNIPKFLESETIVTYDHNADGSNITQTRVGVTSLRTHPDYITYYTMWTRLLATGIFPLAMLAILNTKIYLALRRSKAQLRSMAIRAALPMAILGKPASPPSQMDLRIDSNWPQNGHHVTNGVANGVSAPLTSNATTVASAVAAGSCTSPKSPRPHPMNRSVSAAVVESAQRRIRSKEPIARSQSTAAATTMHTNGRANGHANGHASSQSANGNGTANDLNLAPVLFGVVIVFIFCNTLRVFLNMYDFAVVDDIISCEKKGVGRMPPPWIVCTVSISNLLLMINSSVNFLVYCVAGSKFRSTLYQNLASIFKRLLPESHDQRNQGGNGNTSETALLRPTKHPQLMALPSNNTAFSQNRGRNGGLGGRNRLLEASTAVARHPRIVEV